MICFGATAFRYGRGTRPLPKIGPWRDRLDEVLLSNELETPRERLTLIRVFEDLRRLGYEGGYEAVRRSARSWRRKRGSVVPNRRKALLPALVTNPSFSPIDAKMLAYC